MKSNKHLLAPFVDAYTTLFQTEWCYRGGRITIEDTQPNELQRLFDLVAARRPDLLHRSLFAERERSTVRIELILRETMRELEAMAKDTSGMEIPYVANLRFNHSTRKIHAGHSHRWVYLFPENSN